MLDGVGVISEIGPGAGAYLQHPSGESGEVLAPQPAQHRGFMRGDNRPHLGEEWVIQRLAWCG